MGWGDEMNPIIDNANNYFGSEAAEAGEEIGLPIIPAEFASVHWFAPSFIQSTAVDVQLELLKHPSDKGLNQQKLSIDFKHGANERSGQSGTCPTPLGVGYIASHSEVVGQIVTQLGGAVESAHLQQALPLAGTALWAAAEKETGICEIGEITNSCWSTNMTAELNWGGTWFLGECSKGTPCRSIDQTPKKHDLTLMPQRMLQLNLQNSLSTISPAGTFEMGFSDGSAFGMLTTLEAVLGASEMGCPVAGMIQVDNTAESLLDILKLRAAQTGWEDSAEYAGDWKRYIDAVSAKMKEEKLKPIPLLHISNGGADSLMSYDETNPANPAIYEAWDYILHNTTTPIFDPFRLVVPPTASQPQGLAHGFFQQYGPVIATWIRGVAGGYYDKDTLAEATAKTFINAVTKLRADWKEDQGKKPAGC